MKPDKFEKTCLYIENFRAIKKFCVHNRNHIHFVDLRKKIITQPQAFVLDVFDLIAQIYVVKERNKYKKTYSYIKNKVYRISKNDVKLIAKILFLHLYNLLLLLYI